MSTHLGRNINILRKNAGLTYSALARKSGVSQASVWGIENGEILRPSAEAIHKIGLVFNTTVEDLLSTKDFGLVRLLVDNIS